MCPVPKKDDLSRISNYRPISLTESPLLYSIFLDQLVHQLRTCSAGIYLPFNNKKVNCLLYADNIALIATNHSDLAQLLRIAEIDSLSRFYRFNPLKCVGVSPTNSFASLSLYGTAILKEYHFNYLGVEFNCDGISKRLHFENRIKKAETSSYFLNYEGMNRFGFHPIACLRLLHSFVRSGLEYGISVMNASEKDLEKLGICFKKMYMYCIGNLH